MEKDLPEIEIRDIFIVSEKIKKVIDSCKTEEHFVGVNNMIKSFQRVYEDDPDEFGCTNSLLSHLNSIQNERH